MCMTPDCRHRLVTVIVAIVVVVVVVRSDTARQRRQQLAVVRGPPRLQRASDCWRVGGQGRPILRPAGSLPPPWDGRLPRPVHSGHVPQQPRAERRRDVSESADVSVSCDVSESSDARGGEAIATAAAAVAVAGGVR